MSTPHSPTPPTSSPAPTPSAVPLPDRVAPSDRWRIRSVADQEAAAPVSRRELRDFGWLMGGVVIVVFGLLLPAVYGREPKPWVFGLGLTLLVWGTLWPTGLRLPYVAWMTIGKALGWVNTRLLLGLVYYVVITPMGWCLRALGKDPLNRRLEPDAASYRLPSRTTKPTHMEAPF